MELHVEITDCQRILYAGFTSTQESGKKWLNVSYYIHTLRKIQISIFIFAQDVCLHLTTLCRHLHKFLVFNSDSNETIVDMCLLCTNQLIICVQQLECTLNVEQEHATVLPTARQHFLDRMLWCLDRLKFIDNSSMVIPALADNANFVNYMDIALELVAPMAIFSNSDINCSNVAARNAEVRNANHQTT